MPYHVSRNGQTYGPYTLEDLQRYVASGNVLLTDLAKSEEMPDWLPVAQILGVPSGTPSPDLPIPKPPAPRTPIRRTSTGVSNCCWASLPADSSSWSGTSSSPHGPSVSSPPSTLC